ncbi:MAG: DMT family transporter [Bacillota bacterium]
MRSKSSLVPLHAAVMLFGIAGLFGKLIALPSIVIVFGRVLFAAVFLFFCTYTLKHDIRLKEKKDYVSMLLMGAILAFHWVSFFLSIQLSTVAIGLLTFSSFPIFVTFLEPVFFKIKLHVRNLLLAVVVVFGVILVVPVYEADKAMLAGALWGIMSGLSFAVLSLMNKRLAGIYSGLVISFYQDCIAAVILLPMVLYISPVFSAKDVLLLTVLGVVFTGVSHALFISSLANVKAHTASIIACLEPVYGILLGVLLLGENPGARSIAGGCIIIGASLYSSIKQVSQPQNAY